MKLLLTKKAPFVARKKLFYRVQKIISILKNPERDRCERFPL
jgi:hypothetical protein